MHICIFDIIYHMCTIPFYVIYHMVTICYRDFILWHNKQTFVIYIEVKYIMKLTQKGGKKMELHCWKGLTLEAGIRNLGGSGGKWDINREMQEKWNVRKWKYSNLPCVGSYMERHKESKWIFRHTWKSSINELIDVEKNEWKIS